MAIVKDPSPHASRLFAILFLPVFAVSVLLPAIPVAVWTARDAVLQVFAGLALTWILWTGWRGSRDSKTPAFSLDIVDILFIGLLAWFAVSAGNSRLSFEGQAALRGAFASLAWWFALRYAFRWWPALFRAFKFVLLGSALVAAAWILGMTVQARWAAPVSVFTKVNAVFAVLGVLLILAGWVLRHRGAGPFLLVGAMLCFSAALTWGLVLEQREGPFPNVNIAAGFLGAAFLVAVSACVKGSWGCRALASVLFLAWAVTQSRGAFLSMLLVVSAMMIFHMKGIESRLSGWTRGKWLMAALVVTAVLVALLPMIIRFFHAVELDPRAYWRWLVWESALKMALQAPLLGYGPGSFGEIYPYFRHPGLWATQNPFAHNEYLQIAAECGWPALAGLAILLLSAGANLAKRARRSRDAEWILWALVLTVVHNAVDFTFHEWSVRLMILGLAAYGLRDPARGEMDLKIHFSPRLLTVAAAVTALLVLLQTGWFSATDYFARRYYSGGLKLQNAGELDAAETLLKRSLAFRPGFMGPWNSLGVLEMDRAARLPRSDAKSHLRRAREYFEKAAETSPYSIVPKENLVDYLEMTGSLAEALSFQRGLTSAMPAYPPHYLREGRLLLRMGRPREAVDRLAEASGIDAYYMPVRVLKAEALENAGDRESALKEYRSILKDLTELKVREGVDAVEKRIRRLGGG